MTQPRLLVRPALAAAILPFATPAAAALLATPAGAAMPAAPTAVGFLEPLDHRDVPAAATSIAHLDLRLAMSTRLGAEMLAYFKRINEDDVLAAFTTKLDIELGEDIRAVTLYDVPALEGKRDGKGGAVLLVYGSADLDRWDEALADEQEKPAAPPQLAGRPVRRVHDGDGDWLAVMLPRGTDDDGRLWVVGSDLAALEAAVSVIEGDAPAAEPDRWQVASPPEGAFLYVAAPSLDRLEHWAPISEVAGKARGYSLAFGQRAETAFAQLQLTAAEEADAEAIVGVCQGLIGLARLTLSKDAEARPLLQLLGSFQFATRGALVEISFSHDVEAMCDALRKLSNDHGDPAPEEHDEAPREQADQPGEKDGQDGPERP